MKIALVASAALTIAILSLPVAAAPTGPQAGPPPGENAATPRHGPPQEAVDACGGKKNGDTCSFTAPHGTVSGNCRVVPEGKTACVPQRGGQAAHGGPGGSGQGMPPPRQ